MFNEESSSFNNKSLELHPKQQKAFKAIFYNVLHLSSINRELNLKDAIRNISDMKQISKCPNRAF